MERILGPAPALPIAEVAPIGMPTPAGLPQGTPPKSAGELALERRLTGPAFARFSKEENQSAPTTPAGQSADPAAFAAARARMGEEAPDSPHALSALLHPTVTPAVAASVLPTRRFLLSKGAFIDCTLETAIDSTLPGMTTCITATDTFSADGTVVLLERGTKLVGETRGEIQQGAARIFVLWTEARTPTGVVVPLSSPGTDELGRSGLTGEVNRHFWDRFGAAILLTVINGAVQGAVNSRNSSGSVVISPSTSTDVMSELLRGTLSIPPTVTKSQGDRIQVLVARDVDFRPVYALRVANSAAAAGGNP
jgi:type IV secretion system protein VirB10